MSSGSTMAAVKAFVAVRLWESVAVRPNDAMPATVGRPLRVPSESRDTPAGSDPLASVHV